MEVWEDDEEPDFPYITVTNTFPYPIVVIEKYAWTWRGLLARFRGEYLLKYEIGPWERMDIMYRPFIALDYEPSETTKH